jgi:hypothetical protein
VTRRKVIDFQRQRSSEVMAAGGSSAGGRLAQVSEKEDLSEPVYGLLAEAEAICRRALELIRGNFAESTWRAFWVAVDGRAAADVAEALGGILCVILTGKQPCVGGNTEEALQKAPR